MANEEADDGDDEHDGLQVSCRSARLRLSFSDSGD